MALRSFLLAVLCSALFAGAAVAKRAPVGDVAQGAGVVGDPATAGDTFAFDARSGVNGENAMGTMTYFDSRSNVTVRGEVRCMSVTGNRAFLAGIVTESPIASGHIEVTDCTALTRNGKRCAKVKQHR